jgi:hypothetical protein
MQFSVAWRSPFSVFFLLQIANLLYAEYALNAVNQGVTALGIKGMLK